MIKTIDAEGNNGGQLWIFVPEFACQSEEKHVI
jgi:hypothetical protein